MHFKHSLVEKAEPVLVHFTLRLRDQRTKWIQDECKVYMDFYMALYGSCFMVTWTIFKNHFLEVGVPQNRETMALRNLTTIDLLYFVMWEDPSRIEIHWNSIWSRARSHTTSQYTWGLVTTLHGFGSVLGRPLDTSFGLTILWSQPLARVWSDPKWISWRWLNECNLIVKHPPISTTPCTFLEFCL